MPDPTGAQRQRDWAARQKAGTPWKPFVCAACGANSSGKYDPWCSRCREKLTPEGRAVKARRVRKAKAKKRALAKCDVL
jgi:hypothetical protein